MGLLGLLSLLCLFDVLGVLGPLGVFSLLDLLGFLSLLSRLFVHFLEKFTKFFMKSFFSQLGNLSVCVPPSSSTLKTLVRFIVELLKNLNTKIVDELMKLYVMAYFHTRNKIYPPQGECEITSVGSN